MTPTEYANLSEAERKKIPIEEKLEILAVADEEEK